MYSGTSKIGTARPLLRLGQLTHWDNSSIIEIGTANTLGQLVHYREVVHFWTDVLPLYRLVNWKVSFLQRYPLLGDRVATLYL